MDLSWLLICAFLVFLMQAGFLCLESGHTRSKNSFNVAAKNVTDFTVAAIIFWLIGFGLMFGDGWQGLFGLSDFAFGSTQSATQISFFLFQMMFCGTAATLMSGAVAERMSFYGYIAMTVVLCALIYPIVGHWGWASIYNESNQGWLESMGFVDFAGSTIVHSVGGWVALAAVIIIGPRLGRFNHKRPPPSGSNLTLSVLGTFFIWLGWFGFNGGSTLILSDDVPRIILNTAIAAAFGGITAGFYFNLVNRYTDIISTLNGIIAGLVAVTASAHAVTPLAAALIGVIGGIVMLVGNKLLIKFKIDDVLSVVPVHLFAGIWGTVAVALFSDMSVLGTGLTRPQQLSVQFFGILSVGAYAFSVALIALYILRHFIRLRVPPRDEVLGLNMTEHQAKTELYDLLNSMQSQAKRSVFDKPVKVDAFTEVGQIAQGYNRVIRRVKEEMEQRDLALNDYQTSERRKSAILHSSMDCIISIDTDGNIMEFNPAAERTFAVDKRIVEGRSFIDYFVLENDRDSLEHSLQYQFTASRGVLLNRRNSLQLRRYDGHQFPAELTITTADTHTKVNKEYTLHIRDITRQRKLQNKLQHLAYRDPLTELYNRAYFMQDLAAKLELNDVPIISVFFLDLDRFKKINDTLGHQAGDDLLKEVSARLRKVTREEDVIARWGGDEFVVMLSGDLSETLLAKRANQILEVMREPVQLIGRELKIPTSIGIAYTATPIEANTLIQHADIAMYFAKEAGRDTFRIFEPEMALRAHRNFDHEQALRRALSNKSEMTMVYQPKVNQHGVIVGLEALVRWQRQDGSFFSPAEFIPVAEETNLIIPLDEHIFDLVCQQITTWRNRNMRIPPVAINISGKNLLSGTLVQYIKSTLAEYQLDGTSIEIEVTEGVLIDDIERCCQVLSELRELNIRIAIDDFGTGYSSLSYLKSLPVDILKIDKSFVDECAASQEDSKICSTVISLADGLKLDTVAEGVENEAQFEFLRRLGCHVYQGYYFYRPQSAAQIEALLGQPQNVINLVQQKAEKHA